MTIARYEWPLRELDFDVTVHLSFDIPYPGSEKPAYPAYSIKPALPFYLDSKRELRISIDEGRLIVEYV